MALSLFAPEMREEFLRRQDLDPLMKTKLKGLTFRLVMLSLDAPGKQDRQMAMNLQGGRFITIVYDIQAAPSELRTMPFDKHRFDARFTAQHELFVELCQGKIDISEQEEFLDALPSGKYAHLYQNMLKNWIRTYFDR